MFQTIISNSEEMYALYIPSLRDSLWQVNSVVTKACKAENLYQNALVCEELFHWQMSINQVLVG